MNKVYYIILIPLFLFASCQENERASIDNIQITESSYGTSFQINLNKFSRFYKQVKNLDKFNFGYQSPERRKFKRFPGEREGIKITDLKSNQRIQLNDLLNDLLSGQGYLKLIGIISNEDASARADDELGREKYWFTFFGEPKDNKNWGFRFEGHHASFNFSFYGDKLISGTPFIIGCDPSIMQNGKWSPLTKDDEYREGYNVLFEEEDLALELLNSLTEEIYKKGFVKLKTGIDLICEDNSILDMNILFKSAQIENGISFSDLKKSQKNKFIDLINVYFSNLKEQNITERELVESNTRLIFNGDIQKNKKFYYRIINDKFIIEFQNIGNHIHCMLRCFNNDFGLNK